MTTHGVESRRVGAVCDRECEKKLLQRIQLIEEEQENAPTQPALWLRCALQMSLVRLQRLRTLVIFDPDRDRVGPDPAAVRCHRRRFPPPVVFISLSL